MKHGENGMTDRESRAFVQALEIIVEMSTSKEEALKQIERVAAKLEKEPTSPEQGH